jgi:hypothetical protein
MRKKSAQKRKRVQASIIPKKGAKKAKVYARRSRVSRSISTPSEQLAAYQLNKLKREDTAPKLSLSEQLQAKIKKPMLNSSIIERTAKEATHKYMPLTKTYNAPEDIRDTREARNEAIRNSVYDQLQNDRAKYEFDLQMADASGKAAEGLPVSHLHSDALERYINNLNESEDRAKTNEDDLKRHRDLLALRHHGRQDVPIEEATHTPLQSPVSMGGVQTTPPSPITPTTPMSIESSSHNASPMSTAPQPISVNINIQGGNGAPVSVSQSPTPAPQRMVPPSVQTSTPVQGTVMSPRQPSTSPSVSVQSSAPNDDTSMGSASTHSDSLNDLLQYQNV